jgi:transcriptional regulator with XRE-family HTH domain
MAAINDNIKVYRLKKGMTQEELATAMGKKSKNTVAGWENDNHVLRCQQFSMNASSQSVPNTK